MSICLASTPALAHDLDATLATYNTAAAGLQAKWDDFQDKQDAAFADVKDMYENLALYYYLVVSDETAANMHWQAHLDAYARLDNITAVPVTPALYELLDSLETTLTAIHEVQAADIEDRNYVAYNMGQVHFVLPEQNFLFWRDPDYPDLDAWIPCTFPVLAKGDAIGHISFQLMSETELFPFLDELFKYLKVGRFAQNHVNDGPIINQAGASIFDQMCRNCHNGYMNMLYPIDCMITQAEMDDWCENIGTGGMELCDDDNISDMDKNVAAMKINECFQQTPVDRLKEVAEDGLHAAYSSQINWPIYN